MKTDKKPEQLERPEVRIVWMSRHHPTKRQRAVLGLLFPFHTLILDNRAFDSAETIITRFHEWHADEMVVVAPLTVVRELVRRGIFPLWAEMKQVAADNREAEVHYSGRHYKFVRFHRVRDVRFVLEDVNPDEEIAPT